MSEAFGIGLYNTLNNDSTLTTTLGATILYGKFPKNPTDYPIVFIQIISDVPNNYKSTKHRIIDVDIMCVHNTATNPLSIAERVRTLLDGQEITISGWTNYVTSVLGPSLDATKENNIAYLTAQFYVEQD